MKWYEFDQNNSGGNFVTNDKLCHRIFIEAEDADAANKKAEELGIYFNGVEEGKDCPCCGDRWYSAGNGLTFPYDYGSFTEEEAKSHAEKYKISVIESQRKYGNRGSDIIFEDIKTYCEFLEDEYGGWTNPAVRMYFDNGEILEVKGKKKYESTT